MTADFSTLLSWANEVGATVLLALSARYTPTIITYVDRWLNIKETDQQVEAVNASIATAIGSIETKIDQGIMRVGHVNTGNSAILSETADVLAHVSEQARALGMTDSVIAKAIVGGVDTLSRSTPIAAAVSAATKLTT